MIELLRPVQAEAALQIRYNFPLEDLTGEDYLHALAKFRYQDNVERTARQLLNDFRVGQLGAIALEMPSQNNDELRSLSVSMGVMANDEEF